MAQHQNAKTLLDTFCLLVVCNQVSESTDSGTEVKTLDLPVGQDIQTEFTESTEYLKPSEPAMDPAEELEQSTGLS